MASAFVSTTRISIMCRFCIQITLIVAIFQGVCNAEDQSIDVESVRLNTAPAFALIGVEPTAIERPDSPKAFSVAVMGSSDEGTEGDGFFGQNLAIEASPFWWTNTASKLNAADYYLNGSAWQNFQRTFTLSIATKGTSIVGDEGDGGSLGLGFRGNFLMGKNDEALETVQREVNRIVTTGAFSEEEISRILGEFHERVDKPIGWTSQFAGGVGLNSLESKISDLEMKRWGVWLTTGYRSSSTGQLGDLSFLFLARFLQSEYGELDSEYDSTDYGIRLLWSKPGERMSISGEMISRKRSNDIESTKRHALIIEYRLNDKTAITLSSGTNFDENLDGEEEDFTLLGFNVALGKLKSIPLPAN